MGFKKQMDVIKESRKRAESFVQDSRSSFKESTEVDQDAARELKLFIDNDERLYTSQTVSIQKNLAAKKARGTYDHELSKKLWLYLVDAGAKKYAKEFGGTGEVWHEMFPKATRMKAAEEFADEFQVSWENGEYDEYIPKKYQTKKESRDKRYSGYEKYVPQQIKDRLEYLRGEIRAERISYSEIIELQDLAEYIDPGDVELLEPAGVPEFDNLEESTEGDSKYVNIVSTTSQSSEPRNSSLMKDKGGIAVVGNLPHYSVFKPKTEKDRQRLIQWLQESPVGGKTFEESSRSTPDNHQKKILIDTVKNPLKGKFLGGPSAEEAEKVLRTKFKYTDKQIAKLKESRRPLREAKEYILWGLPDGSDDPIDQKILLSNGASMADVEKVKEVAAKDGWHSFKVQTLDLEEPWDAQAAFAGTINPVSKWRKTPESHTG